MKRCTQCILHENMPSISFNEQGVCNSCTNYKKFIPLGEDTLIKTLEKAKGKNRTYDALVPLSGGKDSTFILYLATKVYNLNVLAFTYDNGFFSDLALKNVETALKISNVDHIFYKPNQNLLKKLYKTILLNSGEICGVCGIGITNNIFKISAERNIPLILMGYSPTENDSFTPENIYDTKRFKAILKNSENEITKKEILQFLIYPNLNFFHISIRTRLGEFGKRINPLFYIKNPSDKEMGKIIADEMGWQDKSDSDYTKHLDCWAEPFTNYVREHRFGYSRRICQLSNMVRTGEITREKAIEIHENDNMLQEPQNTEQVLRQLDISRKELNEILQIQPLKYEKYVSKSNKIFAKLKELKG